MTNIIARMFRRRRAYRALGKDTNGNQENFYNIDPKRLTRIVKEKNLGFLRRLGGPKEMITTLQTSAENGISEDAEDIALRRNFFGSNTYHKPPAKRLFSFVLEEFKDPTIMVLLVCAILLLVICIKGDGIKDGLYKAGSVFFAVFLVVVVSAAGNFKQSRQLDKRSSDGHADLEVTVVRNGRQQHISSYDVVVGDIVRLNVGDRIPADGIFLKGDSLEIDESSMTGGRNHVEVNDTTNPFLLSGAKVFDGYALMLVTSVGMNTTWGETMTSISNDANDQQTPLQAQLKNLTSYTRKIGLVLAIIVLVVLLVHYFTGNTKDVDGNREFNGSEMKFLDVMNALVRIMATAVTIVVVAIPEGLPLSVKFILAYSKKRMMGDQAMVRKLSTCETMGSIATICTDKTGTLTLNQMEVKKFSVGGESMPDEPTLRMAPTVLELLHQGVGLNITDSIYRMNSKAEPGFCNNPTEKAIFLWARLKLGMNAEELNQSGSILRIKAFNTEKKRSGVLMRKNNDMTIHVHWKGAADMILSMCSSYYESNGNSKAMDEDERKRFLDIILAMSANSLRCIAFAHKQIPEELMEYSEDGRVRQSLQEDGLTLLGIVGIEDRCRLGIGETVQACKDAKVNIKLITGDNLIAARAVAIECGILEANDQLSSGVTVEGAEFQNYTAGERMQKVENIRVMARSSPFHKLLMVQCLKQKGHVVAVTGDDTNDALALKEADIGMSKRIQGNMVAKESSDIVILDDKFDSVVNVIRWGRCVYNNIQKYIQFQLTVNVVAVIINLVTAVSVGKVPLTAVQLLWVNLIISTLGALALATDLPTQELMKKPPVGRTEPLITNIMWRNLLAQALYQIAILLTLQFKGITIFGVNEKVKDTLIFNTFVLCQVFNEFNTRELEKKNVFQGIQRNKLFLGIVGITVILQVIMVEWVKKIAETERLSYVQWGACFGMAVISWPIGWVVKFIPVCDKPISVILREAPSIEEVIESCLV